MSLAGRPIPPVVSLIAQETFSKGRTLHIAPLGLTLEAARGLQRDPLCGYRRKGDVEYRPWIFRPMTEPRQGWTQSGWRWCPGCVAAAWDDVKRGGRS